MSSTLSKETITSQIHTILGGDFAEEAPPKLDTDNWPLPENHNLSLIEEIFGNDNISNIEEYINIKQITRPKYMFGEEKLIAIDDTVEYKKESQYLASLSVAILFLHKIRDIQSTDKLKLLWNNTISIIIYLIDNGSNIDESFVFHERSNTLPHPDWILYTPLYLIHLLLTYTKYKYKNNESMQFKQQSITNLYHYMLRNCCNSNQLPSMYTIRIYVDKNNQYQRGFDHRFFGNVFKKLPSKQDINNLLLRGIQPFRLCTRIKDNDFLLNEDKEKVITLNEMKVISGKDFELFSVSIYIYALVQQFTSIRNELLIMLREFDTVYNIIHDIWECVLSFMYQDVMEFTAPKMNLYELKKSIITKIPQVKVFRDENDFEFWLNDVLNDKKVIHEMETGKLIRSWSALMDKKLWKCINALSLIILYRDDFGEYMKQHPTISTEILNKCCNLTLHSTHFIDIYWEILRHCNSFKNTTYHSKLKFSKFIKWVFYHLNKMDIDEDEDNDDDDDDDEDEDDDDDTGEVKDNEDAEVSPTDDEEDWNVEDISVEDEDIGILSYYVNDKTREEIVDKTVLICDTMYKLDAFKPYKRARLLIDILSNAQSKGCVDIIKVLVKNSWDINGIIDGLRCKFGWSLAICAEYNVHDEILEYILSLEPKINQQYNGMWLFLYLIEVRGNNLNDQHLMKFCQFLREYVEEKGLEDVLLEMLTQKSQTNQNQDVLSLFQNGLKYPKFTNYLENLIKTLQEKD